MKYLYQLFIHLFILSCKIASLFSSKVRTMCKGQKQTWQKLSLLDKNKKTIWFHCGSLGEFEQARNLIEYVKNNKKEYQILLTFFSPSGYEVRKDYKYADCICYLPFDSLNNAKRFVKTADPEITFFIKYEFWWNYINELKDRKLYSVSLILRNSHYLFASYSSWFRKQLQSFDFFFVQDQNTANLLGNINYPNHIICGDTRFDRVLSMSEEKKCFPVIERFKDGKKLFLAGSSWPEDEKIIRQVSEEIRDIKIIIAPHLIDKGHINSLLNQFPDSIPFSSLNEDNCTKHDVLIIDNIGMLMYLYSLCDIAYIGGGFGAGIHNILEAAVFDKPVCFGPNNKKFKEAQDLIESGAAKEIHDKKDLQMWIKKLLGEQTEYKRLAAISGNYVRENTGATDKICSMVFNV